MTLMKISAMKLSSALVDIAIELVSLKEKNSKQVISLRNKISIILNEK